MCDAVRSTACVKPTRRTHALTNDKRETVRATDTEMSSQTSLHMHTIRGRLSVKFQNQLKLIQWIVSNCSYSILENRSNLFCDITLKYRKVASDGYGMCRNVISEFRNRQVRTPDAKSWICICLYQKNCAFLGHPVGPAALCDSFYIRP